MEQEASMTAAWVFSNIIWPNLGTLITVGAAAAGVFGFFKRSLSKELTKEIKGINTHIDRLDKRMDTFEAKIISLEERMFWMATGKKLGDAILEEKMKQTTKV